MSTIWTACGSLVLGSALLYICLFTLTIPQRSLIYIRLIIAPLAIRCFWEFGYGSYKPESRMSSTGIATIGIYGVMRVLEHSVVGLWDPTPPFWIVRADGNGRRIALPPPESFRGRCFYAFDLLTSQRGGSWSPDRYWNWIPRRLQLWTVASSRQFVVNGVKVMIIQYLLLDILETIVKSRNWYTMSPHPIMSLSMVEQSIFTMCICAGMFVSMSFHYTIVSTVCVLCGSNPNIWPPMFDSPFCATSLREFWAHRWHWMFRRVFDRLSLPLVRVTTSALRVGGRDDCQKEHIISVIRTIIVFWLSTLLHLFIMCRAAQTEYRKNYGTDHPPFWDRGIIMFFMGQPLGIFLESTVIIRVANWMFPLEDHEDHQHQINTLSHPPSQSITTAGLKLNGICTGNCRKRMAFTWLYAWMFLIWTGRWGADMWVCVGYFNEDEKAIPISPLRGLWLGKW